MAPKLTAVLTDVLERVERGERVDRTWLERNHPDAWQEIGEALSVQDALRDRFPGRSEFGAYRIVDTLGSGSMGTVYLARARDPEVSPGAVAIKLLRRSRIGDPAWERRFRREMRLGRLVRHPNVVWTIAGGVHAPHDPGQCYIVLEHVAGETVRALMLREGPVGDAACRKLLSQAARGLAAIHRAGLVHRDVKPDNLLVASDGMLKVADLGIALNPRADPGAAGSGRFAGTIPYAAPEQMLARESELDGRADLYALGATGLEMLTGDPPVPGEPGEVRERLAGNRVSPLLAEIVLQLLSPDRRDRPRSALELAERIEAGEGSDWWRRARAARAAITRGWIQGPVARWESALVERTDELASLRSGFERAAAGCGAASLVVAATGSGKSRLVDEFLLGLAGLGGDERVVRCAFDPAGGGEAFGVFRTALRALAGEPASAERVGEWLGDAEGLTGAVCRWLDGTMTSADGAAISRETLRRTVRSAFRGTPRQPLIVVLEDVHFAGDDAREIVQALAEPEGATLVIVTSRVATVAVTGCEVIDLAPLSATGVAELLTSAMGPSPDVERLAALVMGSPLSVLAIARELMSGGHLKRRPDGRWRLRRPDQPLPVPADVERAVGSRIATIPAADRIVLDAAAVVGTAFDPAEVGAVAGRAPSDCAAALTGIALQHGLVSERAGTWAFEHQYIHELVHGRIPAPRRREMHATAARLALDGPAPESRAEESGWRLRVCRHLIAAGDAESAAAHVLALAGLLEIQGCDREIVRLADSVLAAPLSGEASRGRLLALKSRALQRTGDSAAAKDAAAAACSIAEGRDDPALTCVALRALGQASHSLRDPDTAQTAFLRAVSAARTAGDLLAECESLTGLAFVHVRAGRTTESVACAEEVLRRCADDDGVAVVCLTAVGDVLRFARRFDQAIEVAQRQIGIADRSGGSAVRAVARANLGHALTEAGRMREALGPLREAAGLHRSFGNARFEAIVQFNIALVLNEVGDVRDALAAAERSLERALTTRMLNDVANAHIILAQICLRLGRPDAALRAANAALSAAVALRFVRLETACRQYRGRALDFLGDAEAARAELRRAREGYLRSGDAPEAAFMSCFIAESLERSGMLTEAGSEVRAAIEEQSPEPASLYLSHCLLVQGRILWAQGREDDARQALRRAHGVIEPGTDVDEEAWVAAYLLLAGSSDPQVTVADVDRLAARAAPVTQMEVQAVLWHVTRDPTRLATARRLLDEFVTHASPPDRARMVAGIGLHRRICEEFDAVCGSGAPPVTPAGSGPR